MKRRKITREKLFPYTGTQLQLPYEIIDKIFKLACLDHKHICPSCDADVLDAEECCQRNDWMDTCGRCTGNYYYVKRSREQEAEKRRKRLIYQIFGAHPTLLNYLYG